MTSTMTITLIETEAMKVNDSDNDNDNDMITTMTSEIIQAQSQDLESHWAQMVQDAGSPALQVNVPCNQNSSKGPPVSRRAYFSKLPHVP